MEAALKTSSAPGATVSSVMPQVAILTGGDDRSYALGLTLSLVAQGVVVDFIGSNRVDSPELHGTALVNFLNLRGDQSENATPSRKVMRLLAYYLRLIKYALVAKPRLFHILWNNKFEWFDRTLLLMYYRLLGRKILFTAHNVNAAKRDGCDNAFNRLTLGIQYRLVSHIFVHTQKMKGELLGDFAVPDGKISVIPFGINNTTPMTGLKGVEARKTLALKPDQKVALFFGQIAPYKGLEYLVAALPELVRCRPDFRLVIAGKVKKGCESYWREIKAALSSEGIRERVITKIEHIPDEDVEIYFKAADVLVLPYTHIFQSGVPFLAYNFGLPVIATDVGSLKDDIIDGKTGFVCKPRDPGDLVMAIMSFFSSEMYCRLDVRRNEIRRIANERYSWAIVGTTTKRVYGSLLDQL